MLSSFFISTHLKKLSDRLNNLADILKRMDRCVEHQKKWHDNPCEVFFVRDREFVENWNSVISLIGEK